MGELRALFSAKRRELSLFNSKNTREEKTRKGQLTISYAALGLLPSIPLPTGASSSTTHRAPINLPSASSSTGNGNEDEVTPKVSYGRIIRDDQGNVIDIILDEEEDQDQGAKDGGEEVEGALNPAKEWVPEKVEAKTDVVRCESFLLFHRGSCLILAFLSLVNRWKWDQILLNHPSADEAN